jgi:chemotaxis family two-component system sensor histidine kinase/response regulator PixL
MLSFDSEIRDQAYQFFIQEAVEFLQTLEDGLIHLRQDRSTAKVHELMRSAHSIKGGAASVGLMGIQRLAHQLEDCLRALYHEEVVVDLELEEMLLLAYDCLRSPLMQQIETGQHDAEAALHQADPIFIQLTERLGDAILGDAAMPTAAELGIDIVEAIFDGDVNDGLNRWETLLGNIVDPVELQSELRAQAEVFTGVGELVNLPGFIAIAKATLAALQAHPDQVAEIGQLALVNFRSAQQAVLAGDRQEGGQVSQALQDFASSSLQDLISPPTAQIASALHPDQDWENALSVIEGWESAPACDEMVADVPLSNALGNPGQSEELEALPPSWMELDTFFGSPLDQEATPVDDSVPSLWDELYTLQRINLESGKNEASIRSASPEPAAQSWGDAWSETSSAAPDPQSVPAPGASDDQTLGAMLQQSGSGTPVPSPLPPGDDPEEITSSTTLSPSPSSAADSSLAPDLSLPETTAPAIPSPEGNVSFDATIRQLLAQAQSSFPNNDALTQANLQRAQPRVDAAVVGSPSVPPPATASRITSAATAGSTPTETTPNQTSRPTAASSSAAQSALSNTIRIDLSRLERINNLVGELVTQENGALLQAQQIQTIVLAVTQRFGEFETLVKVLGAWSDRSQNQRAKQQGGAWFAPPADQPQPAEILPGMDATFDPLQMDVYSDLYTLMQEAIELIAQMGEGMRDLGLLAQQSQQSQRHKQQTIKQIRDDVLWARMLPLGDLLQRFPRMIRDLAAQYDKQVCLKLTGTQVLVDKSILQSLYDPLVHLVRNAFDHGVEPAEERRAQGKSPEGTIEIRAFHRGNQTYIEIIDDGRGIDPQKVRAKILSLGLVSEEELQTLSDERVLKYIFAPGFSTAQWVSQLSGRGVGLDAVQLEIRQLKGSVSVRSQVGQGTTFTLKLPLTLSISNLLVFSIASQLMALPVNTLTGIVSTTVDQIRTIRGEQFFQFKNQLVPLYPREQFLHHYPLRRNSSTALKGMTLAEEGKVTLLLMGTENELTALLVDQIIQEQELVIKPFGRAINPPYYLYGCTILGDGTLVPVIDGSVLTGQSKLSNSRQQMSTVPSTDLTQEALSPPTQSAAITIKEATVPTILVVDDSLTTRQTLSLTLKKAGYRVLQAKDGREALEQLQREPEIQAVFCDVEMPRMNGFEFLSHCRQLYPKTVLPVIMLTSRSGEKHRQIAQFMGASSYLTKPYLEQELLSSLQQLVHS